MAEADQVLVSVAHQPNWFPRLKTMCKLAVADLWIVLDDVQFVQREWQNRCRVHPLNGKQESFWLTLPVARPAGRASAINDVRIVDVPDTARRMSASLTHAYGRSRYWADVAATAGPVLEELGSSLVEASVASTIAVLDVTRAPVGTVPAGALVQPGSPSSRIAEACRLAGASRYVAGPGSRAYLRPQEFLGRGVEVVWQTWESDLVGREVNPDWSCLDFIARYGVEELADIFTRLRLAYRQQ